MYYFLPSSPFLLWMGSHSVQPTSSSSTSMTLLHTFFTFYTFLLCARAPALVCVCVWIFVLFMFFLFERLQILLKNCSNLNCLRWRRIFLLHSIFLCSLIFCRVNRFPWMQTSIQMFIFTHFMCGYNIVFVLASHICAPQVWALAHFSKLSRLSWHPESRYRDSGNVNVHKLKVNTNDHLRLFTTESKTWKWNALHSQPLKCVVRRTYWTEQVNESHICL